MKKIQSIVARTFGACEVARTHIRLAELNATFSEYSTVAAFTWVDGEKRQFQFDKCYRLISLSLMFICIIYGVYSTFSEATCNYEANKHLVAWKLVDISLLCGYGETVFLLFMKGIFDCAPKGRNLVSQNGLANKG